MGQREAHQAHCSQAPTVCFTIAIPRFASPPPSLQWRLPHDLRRRKPPISLPNSASISPPSPSSSMPIPRRSLPCFINTLINLCTAGKIKEAVDSVAVLSHRGVRLNSATFAFLLRHCAKSRALKEGKQLHLCLKTTGRKKPGTIISNHLINLYFCCGDHIEARKVFDKMPSKNLHSWNNALSGYAKAGMLSAAQKLFDKMPERDVVSWNTMVIGYAKIGNCGEALRVFGGLRRTSIELNEFSFAGVLTAGLKLMDLGLVRQVHGRILVAGFLHNVVLSSSILDAYAKCGDMDDARRVFSEMSVRDVFSWTMLISAYAKWGDTKSAKELFDLMPEKSMVSWTAMISGYARNGLGHKSLESFREMMLSRVLPEQYAYSSCLSACGKITALKQGMQIHGHMVSSGFSPNFTVLSSLIDMYAKCGSLESSKKVFELSTEKQDVVLWNPMISALAQHGYGKEAIQCFDDMLMSGVHPNRVTFIILLSACSHSGLTEQGLQFFKSMASDYDIFPDEEHYACLVDLLGRAGKFTELIDELEKMPCNGDKRIWDSLIGVCSIHGNLDLGKTTAERRIELDPESSGSYLLLSSVYAAIGNWESAQKVRETMEQRCVKKVQGRSWIDAQKKGALKAFVS